MKIPKFLSKYFCCFSPSRRTNTAPINPSEDHIDQADEAAATDGTCSPVCHRIARYSSCMVYVASEIAQVAVRYFVHGSAGEEASTIIDIAAQAGAIAAHEIADRMIDNDFYVERAELPQAQRHPEIEEWAEGISRRTNTAIGLVNAGTQLVATGRIPVHDLVAGLQGVVVFSAVIGFPWSTSTVQAIHGLGLFSLSHRMAHAHIPTSVIGTTSNTFFDWISDDVIRGGIIYPIVNRIENGLDVLQGYEPEVPQEIIADERFEDLYNDIAQPHNDANSASILALCTALLYVAIEHGCI